MHLFTSRNFHGTLTECDEGVLEWVPKNKLEELHLWEGDKIFFRLLDEGYPFFSLKLVYENESLIHIVLDGKKIK